MSKPTELASAMASDPTFAHDASGTPITRQQACACGTRFTQRQLSERFLKIIEKRGPHAMALMQHQIPDFFVPVHCPKCERVDLGQRARLSGYTYHPEAAD